MKKNYINELESIQNLLNKVRTINESVLYNEEYDNFEDEIYEKVWNEQSFAPENTVSVHISRIREKIEINPKEPRYLKVVWGIGYKIEKYQ